MLKLLEEACKRREEESERKEEKCHAEYDCYKKRKKKKVKSFLYIRETMTNKSGRRGIRLFEIIYYITSKTEPRTTELRRAITL